MNPVNRSLFSRFLTILLAILTAGLPLLAEQPPAGYARPPIHVRGNATKGPTGYTPVMVKKAYGFDQIVNQGAGQTIAIVDAYDDPNIESDLGAFNNRLGLPPCISSSPPGAGCFQKIYASGSKPNTNAGWSLEISLDVEWAHAIAPAAKIILVEAASNSFTNLLLAVDVAVANGASVVSMSWGGGEFSSESNYDGHFMSPTPPNAGVTFTASSGDSGSGVEYPAASPYVVSVGGTTLKLIDSFGTYGSETTWSGSGGGLSSLEPEPGYQSSLQLLSYPKGIPNDLSAKRGVPDVSYDADPNTGFPVYDTVRYQGQSGWFQVGGTSAGAPQWAALIAIANSMRASLTQPKSALSISSDLSSSPVYSAATANYLANYHDIASGSNGSCGTLCNAGTGYDYVTGLGSPLNVSSPSGVISGIITALVSQP